ncbi:MAG: hypothetical protein NXI27_21670 [Alphaproteobacteria bacterium]|nr:hypothetical protein [Alphaproteobacteria bacterium]
MNETTDKAKGDKPESARLRVLAGFGSIADEAPTIEAAMALAEALEAEITGCFVEDVDLLNLAALPFARAVRPADRTVLDIEHEQMKRQISRAASTCENLLLARAGTTSVRCTFRTRKGGYLAEIASETATSDIVVVNPLNLPHRRQDAFSLLLDRLRQATGAVILPERTRHGTGGPVVLVAAGATLASNDLDLAGRIARTLSDQIVILTGGDQPADRSALRAAARNLFGSRVDIRDIPDNHVQSMAAMLEELKPSFVLLQPPPGPLSDPMIELLLNAGRAPLLLMRRSDDQ